MLSNLALSHEGKFGETTAIIDRCIFESAIKLMWLSRHASQQEFDRYLADGLKTDIEFKDYVQAIVAANDGDALPMEIRTISSIDKHIAAAGMTDAQIRSTPKFRDVASLVSGLGFDRIFYVIGQKIGSHHVHGTWTSLYLHYLQEDTDQGPYRYGPRGHDCDIHLNQFVYISRIVLRAIGSYVRHVLKEPEASGFSDLIQSVDSEIVTVFNSLQDDDT